MSLRTPPKASPIVRSFPGLFMVVCVVLMAVLCSLTIVVRPPAWLLLGLGSAVFVSYIVAFEKAQWLIAGLILSAAVNYSFWLDHRIEIQGFPISFLDALAIIYGVYGVIAWFRARRRLGLDRLVGICFLIWFIYSSAVGIGIGIVEDNPAYASLQEYRLVLYAALAYFATLTIFRPERHLRVVILYQIAAGFLVSIWQLAITVSGRNLAATEIVMESAGGLVRLVRDANLPGTFAAAALVVLVVVQMKAPTILGKLRRWAWGLIPIFVAASFLSMTRTVWVAMVLSLGLLLIYLVFSGWRRIHLSRLIITFAFFLVVIPLVFTMVSILVPEVYQALKMAWDMSFTFQDTTFLVRLEQSQNTLSYLWDEGWAFWFGLGFGNISSGAARLGPFTSIHNAYMWYMVIAGLPGLLLFLALWISPLIVYLRLLTLSLETVTHLYVIASIVNWLVMSVIMLGSPALWTNAALFGMMCGIASVLAKTCADRKLVGCPNGLRFTVG